MKDEKFIVVALETVVGLLIASVLLPMAWIACLIYVALRFPFKPKGW